MKKHFIKALLILSFISIAILILIYPLNFFNCSQFKTQEVLFRHADYPFITIEYQMQDIGALGYNRRISKVLNLMILDLNFSVDTNSINMKKWLRVDEYVNELGLKGG